jgi:hypothetical protein
MDAAQYYMQLVMARRDSEGASAPTTQLLVHISTNQEYYVHWSRHLLANIRLGRRTGCELLIGASAVTYNPHFPYFSSQPLPDVHLGAVTELPRVPAL